MLASAHLVGSKLLRFGNASGKNKRRARGVFPAKRLIQTRANCALCCPRAVLRSRNDRNRRNRKLSCGFQDITFGGASYGPTKVHHGTILAGSTRLLDEGACGAANFVCYP